MKKWQQTGDSRIWIINGSDTFHSQHHRFDSAGVADHLHCTAQPVRVFAKR